MTASRSIATSNGSPDLPFSDPEELISKPTLMLVDGYGLIFRAYHAIQTGMATSTGELTNAVFGFASMLFNILNNQKPDYAIVALESGKTFRHDEFEDYKANRAAMPEELRSQVVRIRELIEALGLPIIERENYEADDVIGSLAHDAALNRGMHVVILTGDTDLLQLVEPDVDVFLPGVPRFDQFREYDRAAVVDRYGFGPEFVADFKALKGDPSDNIPGVPGIGEKSATQLIETFGSIESIYSHLDEIEPTRVRNALTGKEDVALTSKRLTTIVRDLDVDFDLEAARVADFDREAVVDLLQQLEFRSLLGRIPESDQPSASVTTKARPDSTRRLITTREDLDTFLADVRKTGLLCIDVETTSTDPITADLVGIAMAWSPTESAYVPIKHEQGDNLPLSEIREALGPVLQDPAIVRVAHHGKYDALVLERFDLPLGSVDFDTMIAAYLLGESSVGLKDLAFSRLGLQMTEIKELIGTGKSQLTMDVIDARKAGDYACGDVEATLSLQALFSPELEERQQHPLFATIEMPLVPVLIRMERTGVAIDSEFLDVLSEEIRTRLMQLENSIYEQAGQEFNINSTRRLATILFEELGLSSGRKTKTGYSVDQQVLENLRNDHPIIESILEFRTLGKLLSTYVDALPQQVSPVTGRIHTSYNQTVAATGRLSSANPNLQNIPIRTELGRRVRRAFVPGTEAKNRLFDDPVLVAADYSQIELRLMAHLSQDAFLLDAFNRGEDVHRATASLVYSVPVDEVTSDMRRVAKTVNFGLLYGMQAFGLSRDTGLSRSDAQAFITDYWAKLPAVKTYVDSIVDFGIKHGYVETLSGRRRLLPDLTSSNPARRAGAERMAVNMPVQGTAADIMKIAMIETDQRLRDAKIDALIIMQVHDELVLEVDRSAILEAAEVLKSSMENAFELSVPLTTEVRSGPNWDALDPVETTVSVT